MKKFIFLLIVVVLVQISAFSQTVGKTTTEQYKASFETKINIDSLLDYDGPTIPIQILKCGIGDELYDQYPELKEKKVGLGVANITLEYLENLNRFSFTEDKTEIKNRMVKQFQASQAGISQDKLDGRGKIRLAHYFVEIEVNEAWKELLLLLLGAFIGSYGKIIDYWFSDTDKDKMLVQKMDEEDGISLSNTGGSAKSEEE